MTASKFQSVRTARFLIAGMLAPLVYVFTVALGGALRTGYSHMAQPVSDLIAAGAPNAWLLDPLFALYNLLTLAFGIGLLLRVQRDAQQEKRATGWAGAFLLLVEGCAGLLLLFYPEDGSGMTDAISGTGRLHILLAGVCSMSSMAAILLMGFWFRSHPRLRGYGTFSFVSVALIFGSGGLTAFSIANHNPIGGMLERVTVGGFLLWMGVTGAGMWQRSIIRFEEKEGSRSPLSESHRQR